MSDETLDALVDVDEGAAADEREPWERLPEETDKAYQAFRFYAELGRERTLREAWLQYCEWRWGEERRAEEARKNAGDVGRHLEEWSAEHDWQRRARAWQEHLEELEQRKLEQQHLEELEDHRQSVKSFAQDARETADAAMRQLEEVLGEIDAEDVDAMSAASLMRAMTDLYKASIEAESHALGVDELVKSLEAEGRMIGSSSDEK